MTDVIVIGGGASGMIAALTAAENGRSVVLLERQSRVGASCWPPATAGAT